MIRRLVRVCLVLPLALGPACGRSGPPPRPNVIVVLVDTLRRDHLGCFGYDRPTSPHIDALAARGLRFDEATSTSSWTLPSVTSLLTSLYPGTHGLVSNEPLKQGRQPVLAQCVTTLAESFAAAGYATAAIVTNVFLNPSFQLDQGFQAYGGGPLTAPEVVQQGLVLLGQAHAAGQPAFLYLHMNDVHGPYDPPAGYVDRFHSETQTPLTIEQVRKLGYLRSSGVTAPDSASDWLERYIDLYDGQIAYVDAAVGNLVAGLRSMGLEDSTLVLFVADHGEKFLDHGGFDHGATLYDVVIRVPMIAVWPGHIPAGKATDGTISLVDVMPTLLDLCAVPVPEGLEGKSRAAGVTNGVLPKEPVYAELNIRGPYRVAERTPDAKWVLDASKGELVRAFDLDLDPGETENRIADPGPEGRAAAARLAEFVRERRERRAALKAAGEAPVDPAVRKALESLGYLR